MGFSPREKRLTMSVESVKEYLSQFGLADRVMEFDASSATVAEAAADLGCEPARIAKTMAFVVAGIVASLSTLNAATQTTNDIEITDAFVQIVPHSTKSAAAFLTITNNTDQDIALLSAQSTISKNTELHQHIHQDNGVMQMVQVPQILIKSHSSTALAPGGYHIMFINIFIK